MAVLDELLHWQQFDRRHPEVGEVLNGRWMTEAGVGSADFFRHVRVEFGEALDMGFIDHRFGELNSRRDVAGPVEPRVGDHRPRCRRGGIRFIQALGLELVVAENRLAPVVTPHDGGCVRVEQELVRVVPQTVLRVPWAVHAQSVASIDAGAVDHAVEDVARPLRQTVRRF